MSIKKTIAFYFQQSTIPYFSKILFFFKSKHMKSVFFLFVLLHVFSTIAQENINYRLPSQEILALADFERAPSVSMDTKKEFMLLSYRNTYKTLDDLNQEEIRLGGLRINPITNISSTMSYINNLKIRKINSKNEVQVSGLPNNPKIANTPVLYEYRISYFSI